MSDIFSFQKQFKKSSGGTAASEAPSTGAAPRKRNERVMIDYRAIEFTGDQREAFEILKGTENVLITGPAGTGKSTLLKSFYSWYMETEGYKTLDHETIYITSTTGISAMNISGYTIHSWSGIEDGSKTVDYYVEKIRKNSTKKGAYQRWRNTNVLIIDEISMMSGDMFDKLSILGQRIRGNSQPFGGIKVVLFCDFLQLPPVKSEVFCFDAICWRRLRLRTKHLEQIVRQADVEFQGILNKIRFGIVDEEVGNYLTRIHQRTSGGGGGGTGISEDGIVPTRIYPLKRQVQQHNLMELMKLKDDPQNKYHVYHAEYIYSKSVEEYEQEKLRLMVNEGSNSDESIDLCIGSQVMYLVNDRERNLVNGSRGVIVDFIEKDIDGVPTALPLVKFLSHETPILVEYHGWVYEDISKKTVSKRQLPLMLAWALTVHKTQGCTLEYCELNIGRDIFEEGQTYVALSRVKDPAGLFISSLDLSKIRANPRCVAFYHQSRS